MVNIKLPTFKCLRCGHSWVPRKHAYGHGAVLPGNCPKCRSVYWDAPFGAGNQLNSQHLKNKAHGVE